MSYSLLKNKKIFFGVMLLLLIIFVLEGLFSRGKSMSRYFTPATMDSYMDFFHMLSNIPGLDPYKEYANYPAMNFLILRILFHFIPLNENVGDAFFLRNYIYANIVFFVFILVCTIIIWELIKHNLGQTNKINYCLAAIIMMSGPVLFCIERGNLIILSFIFSFLYLLMYSNENMKIRYVAYICLALGASLKLYPALLGVLSIKKGRLREVLALITLGFSFFILPFFAFDGLSSLKMMIHGILISTNRSTAIAGYGINFSFTNLTNIILIASNSIIENLSIFNYIIPLIISGIIFFTANKEWKKILAIVILMIWLPGFSYTYTLLFFILPLLFYLKEKKESWIYAVFFAMILAPNSLPLISGILNYQAILFLTWGMLLINIIICIMCFFCILDNLMHIRDKKNKAKYDS